MKCLGIIFSTLLFVSTARGAVIQVDPAIASAQSGEAFSVQLLGKDFAVNVDGGGLNLTFDPKVVVVQSVSISPIWEFASTPGDIGNANGTVTGMTFNTFANVITGNFDIATVTLRARAAGISPFLLSAFADNPFASGGQIVPVVFERAEVRVVPEPGTCGLLLVGLSLLAFGLYRVDRARRRISIRKQL